jgi:glycosyltransferase involved in cell wall biosynthesis
MKIFVVGTRGIPDIPGGVEKHCEQLYPLVVAKGHEVFLCRRAHYIKLKSHEWKGVKLLDCFTFSQSKHFEAIIHTFIGIIKARFHSPDIVHIHAIGPSLLVPFARLLGLRVVMTHHGSDYERKKWGNIAKFILRMGEKFGCQYANEIIAISHKIAYLIHNQYGRKSYVIPNGVRLPPLSTRTDFLDKLEIEPKGYILAVARFVPEKGLHELIEAFSSLDTPYKLVIAGDADHEDEYSKNLKLKAQKNKRIVLTGYITGEGLHQFYTYARLFVLASHHEGLPIVLLEALSYGLPVLVSDIPANKEIGLPTENYFKCGDVAELGRQLKLHLQKEIIEEEKTTIRHQIKNQYNWDLIVEQTIRVYTKAMGSDLI